MKKDFKPNIQKNDKIEFVNFLGLCKGCGLCVEFCPQKCIIYHKKNTDIYGQPAIDCDVNRCTFCKICERICPEDAILLKRPEGYNKDNSNKL